MTTTFQLLRAGNGKIVRSASGRPFGNNVSAPATNFGNGSRRRMPFAISRDLQPAVIAGKELYFRVTHSDLRTVANGGLSQTGFDFQFETTGGVVVPYIVKSYDAVAGTLFGVFTNNLLGATAATKGYLYFNNTTWTTSREDNTLVLVNGNTCLFLPSGINQTDIGIDMSGDLPTSDKVIVNPGALLNGSTDYIWRALSSPINSFLISCFCQDLDANSDNALWSFGLESGNTVIFIRRLFGTAAQHTGGETNSWRFGWVTTEPGVPGTVSSFYETKSGSSGIGLQHVVIRRFTDGTDPEIYLNGVLEPIVFKFTDLAANAAQRGPISTTGQRLLVGRGSTATRFWHGYMDCFKFYSGTNKTATWAKSEYDNLLDIDGAVIFGDPETVATATMFGETIDITCNGLSSLTFAADKYVTNDTPLAGTPPATPSIQSLTQPAGGSLAVTTGNNVQYSNTSNTDPDNGGAVVMTNGAGTVTVPIRATIVPSIVIAPSGYYKTPNIAGKTPVLVGSLGAPGTPNTLLWAFAQFNLGTFNSATHYIKVTGQIDGGAVGQDILVTAGGTSTHPLVIMAAHPVGADVWTSIPKVKDCCLRLQRQWIWCYGLWSEVLPISHGVQPPNQATWNTTGKTACFSPEANNCFITCCRMAASQGIWHQTSIAILTSFTANYNWYEIAAQQRDPQNAVGASTSDFGYRTEEANGKTITNLTHMYNRYSDHASSLTNASVNFRAVIIGNGNPSGLREPSTGTEIGYNFINAHCSHPMEFKNIPDYVHHNHAPLNGRRPQAGINTRGGNADGPTTGKRPLFLANRVNCTAMEVNCGYADYVSNYLTTDADVVVGSFRLFPLGDPKPTVNKGISGADGTNWVACKGNMILGDANFEPTNYTYGNLGSRSNVVIAGHLGGTFTDGAGGTCAFNAFPPGTMTGAHPNIIESAIIKQSGSLSFTPEVPPILTATICGPNDGNGTGKVWGT